jgi:hypothetical protein
LNVHSKPQQHLLLLQPNLLLLQPNLRQTAPKPLRPK